MHWIKIFSPAQNQIDLEFIKVLGVFLCLQIIVGYTLPLKILDVLSILRHSRWRPRCQKII